ncbi:MAG: phage holin family protein [Sediminibacterium sp.]
MKEKYLPLFVASLIAYLSPIFTSLIFVGCLVMFDWITGIIKGSKLGTLNSRSMIKKFYTGASYLVAIATVRLCEVYFGDEIPLVKPLVAMIALSELQSMRENIESITGIDLLKHAFNFLQRKKES